MKSELTITSLPANMFKTAIWSRTVGAISTWFARWTTNSLDTRLV